MARKKAKEGKDDYRKLIESNSYYVDKTLLIEEFLDIDAEVTLITRPRRFGKTLNMTMMREFFDITTDSKDIFEGTEIMKKPECLKRMNKVPVVFFSFKTCEGNNRDELINRLKDIINTEYDRYYKIFQKSDKLSKKSLNKFNSIAELFDRIDADIELVNKTLVGSIYILTKTIYEHYGIKPIVIIDEYDYPFVEAKIHGYFDKVNTTLSTMFCDAFKTNPYLDKAIMTGIQKIAQESIFSKFNNPSICSVIDVEYFDKFGLTEAETREYLKYFGYELTDEVKNYYDGYKFNGEDIYNPMSITTYIRKSGKLGRYWVNTSSNQLIKDEIPRAKKGFTKKFDELIEKGTIDVAIDFNKTFQEKTAPRNLWGLLVNAGYITVEKKVRNDTYRVRVPNKEVYEEFTKIVLDYTRIDENDIGDMFNALLDKDIDEFKEIYKQIVLECTSFYDGTQKENSYHMLMLGMCVYLKDRFKVESNAETGHGRADITLHPLFEDGLNVIIEFKSKEDKDLQAQADEALQQIKDNKYYTGMKGDILLLGIAHDKKKIEMVHEMMHI